ncbi:hypothetical protein KDAU_00200 [Dictyobacter aurantiacus]|uniref:Uncharacterized protein n=1 Tax=Dictyobacter aurantiacus TaxID=1936993 RepID=A0A401Z761_9CHLR|nr:hypothetical protein KDAU_00200 [Dictyobacter aurantiacus]
MIGLVEMPGRMPVLRGIAASDMAADKAETQVNPAIARLEAILASTARWRHILHLIQMRTTFSHFFSFK